MGLGKRKNRGFSIVIVSEKERKWVKHTLKLIGFLYRWHGKFWTLHSHSKVPRMPYACEIL